MASHPELEAAILASPNDPARYAVYGDWLQAQGDPRGELVSVQAALASTRDTKRFLELKQTETRLLERVTASVLPEANPEQLKLTWRYGFIHELWVGDEGNGLLKHVLAHPAARFVQGVRLDQHEQTAGLAAVIAAPPPLLNRLELGLGTHQNLAAFRAAFPRLQHFVMSGAGVALAADVLLEWPGLQTLELSGVAANELLCRVLRAAPWRNLRRLVLRPLPLRERAVLVDDVTALLSLPDLRHIGLDASIEGAVAVVARRQNLAALKELDLFGYSTNERLEQLLARGPALRGLELIIRQGELSETFEHQLRRAVKGLALAEVELFSTEEAGVHEMDPEEARAWREREERLAQQSDYNRDDWN